MNLVWLAGISVVSENFVSDLAAVFYPSVAVVDIRVSPRRENYRTVKTPPLTAFIGIVIMSVRQNVYFLTLPPYLTLAWLAGIFVVLELVFADLSAV